MRIRQIAALGRLLSEKSIRREIHDFPRLRSFLSTQSGGTEKNVIVEKTTSSATGSISAPLEKEKAVKLEACGDVDEEDDEEMEQEEMFVEPHESFAFKTREWGGPRRGGRLPEPTRYGDWERKGRCSDF